MEREIVSEISAVRADSADLLARLRLRTKHMKGVEYTDPLHPGVVKVTKEGNVAVKDAISHLMMHSSTAEIPLAKGFNPVPVTGMSLAAEDHGADIGRSSSVSHTGSDGSSAADRMNRYGSWTGGCSECIWYGVLDSALCCQYLARLIVEDLIIDDGVSSRGHRRAMLNQKYTCAGIYAGVHATFGNVVVIDFAADFQRDILKEEALSARLRGIPEYDVIGETGGNDCETQWKTLGDCPGCRRPVRGGRVIETCCNKIGSTLKWHEGCFCCGKCNVSLRGSPYKLITAEELAASVPTVGDITTYPEYNAVCSSCWAAHYAPICNSCSRRIATGKMVTWKTFVLDEACYKIAREATLHKDSCVTDLSKSAVISGKEKPTGIIKQANRTGAFVNNCKDTIVDPLFIQIESKGRGGKQYSATKGSKKSLGQAHKVIKSVISDYNDLL